MAIACEIMGESLKCARHGPSDQPYETNGESVRVQQRARVIITIIATCTIMDLGGGAEAGEEGDASSRRETAVCRRRESKSLWRSET